MCGTYAHTHASCGVDAQGMHTCSYACYPNYHDGNTDLKGKKPQSNGCECRDANEGQGNSCKSAIVLESIGDDGWQGAHFRDVMGTLYGPADRDTYLITLHDGAEGFFDWGDNDFQALVRVKSGPPSLRLKISQLPHGYNPCATGPSYFAKACFDGAASQDDEAGNQRLRITVYSNAQGSAANQTFSCADYELLISAWQIGHENNPIRRKCG